ncbi:ABC transporter permease [Streptomyces solisilvae]|uniref:ABC transporter permease n=1 Tax=Streptomyces malaysiensis TaxID=92644 RepID=UPI0036BCD16C
MTLNAPTTPAPVSAIPPGEVDSSAAYTSFTLAFVIGHGAAALSKGTDPVLTLPVWLPLTLFFTGLVPGLVLNLRAVKRAQQGASESRRRAEKLLGAAWATGFTALFLAVTGLSTATGQPELQNVLWPAGSGLVVGLINIAEGAVRRNTLHYNLGSWLALISAASLFLNTAGVYAVLAIAGGAGYAVAATREPRRLAGLSITAGITAAR